MNRAQKRMNHRMYGKKVFKTVFEAREFLIEKCGRIIQIRNVWQEIDELNEQDVCDLLFTCFGSRIALPKTRKPPKPPPEGLETGALFVRVDEKTLEQKSLNKCKICLDERWVCENHPDKPWGGGSSCCGGAGAPCVCNPMNFKSQRVL